LTKNSKPGQYGGVQINYLIYMAIAFNPVVNDKTGTLQATSLEALLLESAFLLQKKESDTPDSVTTIAVNPGFGNNIVTIAANIPVTIVPDAVDGFTIRAVQEPALINAGYSKTAGLAIKAPNINAAVLETAQRLQTIERLADPASDEIQVSINTDTLVATVAASLRFTYTVNGDIIITAAPFIDNGL
jgi:hypothetical protein